MKNLNKEKSINYALKICISVFILIASYFALKLIIIKGNLLSIEPVLMVLFGINAIVVGLKVFKK